MSWISFIISGGWFTGVYIISGDLLAGSRTVADILVESSSAVLTAGLRNTVTDSSSEY